MATLILTEKKQVDVIPIHKEETIFLRKRTSLYKMMIKYGSRGKQQIAHVSLTQKMNSPPTSLHCQPATCSEQRKKTSGGGVRGGGSRKQLGPHKRLLELSTNSSSLFLSPSIRGYTEHRLTNNGENQGMRAGFQWPGRN